MTLPELKHNIEEEMKILRELRILISQREIKVGKEKEIVSKTIDSLTEMLKIMNNSVIKLAENISPIRSLAKSNEAVELVDVKFSRGGETKHAVINEADRKRFIDELTLSEFTMKKLRKDAETREVIFKEFKKPSMYAKISNKMFSRLSNNLIAKGDFKQLGVSLRKANIPFILNTYVSMIFFTVFISLIIAMLAFVFLIFFQLSIDFPIISAA